MGTFVVTAPNGKEYEITAPEGATQEQVLEYAKQNFQSLPETQTQPATSPSVTEQVGRQIGLTGRAAIQGISAPVNPARGLFLKSRYWHQMRNYLTRTPMLPLVCLRGALATCLYY